jgi:serine/threonine-protein kinase
VLLIYVGAAWACFELIDAVTERFGLPEWLPALAVVLFLLGLPFVVATACVHELPARAELPAEAEAGEAAEAAAAHLEARRSHRFLTWRNTAATFLIVLAAWGVVAAGWMLLGDRGPASEVERKSIAVLPFDNLSPDPENEYFADGIHDEIIAHLSRIADLRVISRTSVMEYKGRSENLRTVAEDLGVTNILEGTVRCADGRVRITTQLLDALADEHLWTEVYDRNLSDVFAVQTDVAQQVATALRATLTPAERERIEERPTDNLEAYEFYLQGNVYASGEWTLPVLEGAQRMYERAVEIDPQFALAYAGLSSVHSLFYHGGLDRSTERLRQAEDAVNRALELRPDLPEAHLALGLYHHRGFRDYERALAALDVAEEALPGNVAVLDVKSAIAKRQGRFKEALLLLREARRLDPRNWRVCAEMAINLKWLHRYVEAAAYSDTLLALAPDQIDNHLTKGWLRLSERGETDSLRSALEYVLARGYVPNRTRWFIEFFDRNYAAALDVLAKSEYPAGSYMAPLRAGYTHLAVGDPVKAQAAFDSARRVLEVEVQEYSDDYSRLYNLGLAYAGLGRSDEAIRAGLGAQDLPYAQRDLFHHRAAVRALVWIYAMLGEQDAAIDQLETYLALPSPWTVQADLRDPRYDPLRDHPRFQALLEKYE